MANKYGTYKVSGIPIAFDPSRYGITGKILFVNNSDSTSADNANRGHNMNTPLDTIDYAVGLCTAKSSTYAYNDGVVVLPGHSETTGKTTIDVNGLKVVGLGTGLDKPTLTTATADDVVTITGNNVLFDNFHFAAPGIDAVTAMINIGAATGVTIRNITGIGSTTSMNVVDCITVGDAGADDLLIENVELFNSTVAVNSFLSFEAAASRVRIKNFFAFGDVATAGIIDGAKIDYLVMENVNVGVVGTTKPAATLNSNPEGFARDCNFAGTHGTLATNAALGNLMRLFNVRVLEETDGSVQGALIPAVDVDS